MDKFEKAQDEMIKRLFSQWSQETWKAIFEALEIASAAEKNGVRFWTQKAASRNKKPLITGAYH